ncbi:DUF6160 family protein [Parendozoicomonas sp. Alg238-R29]|uniref:DUF6160 family protein n=1 Tax=Parendozoicomonas sp. Alg238-R29 TaxID=2993446 RepID=UPI00248E244D|nr:DUF6160 family protein [Parendozoicomonas sp. Alg238-R29]
MTLTISAWARLPFLTGFLSCTALYADLQELEDEGMEDVSGRAGITIDAEFQAHIGSVAFEPGGTKSTGYLATADDAGILDNSFSGLTLDVVNLTASRDALGIGHNLTFNIKDADVTGFYASRTPLVIPEAALTSVPQESDYGYLAEILLVPSAHNCSGSLFNYDCDETPPVPRDHARNDDFTVTINKGRFSNPQNIGSGTSNGSISSNGQTWNGNYGSNTTLGCYQNATATGACDFGPIQDRNEQVTVIVAFDSKSDANIRIDLDTSYSADGYLWALDRYGNEIGCSGRSECGNDFNDGPGGRDERLDLNLSEQVIKIPRAEPADYTFLLGVGLSGNFNFTGTTHVFAD